MTKKVPLRMCVVCRTMKEKKDCLRVVKTPEGNYVLDSTGKLSGRGAYVCNNEDCISKCLKTHAFNKAFKANVNGDVYDLIKESKIEQ